MKKEEEIEEMTPEVIEKLAEKVREEMKVEEKAEEKPEEKAEVKGAPEKLEEVTEIKMELEKLKTSLEMMKEERKAMDEKITSLLESVGEMRSMLMHLEGSVKTTSTKVEDIEETLRLLKPKRFEEALRKIDQKIEKNSSSIELQNEKLKHAVDTIGKIQKNLKEMGSIENISKINKEIREKLDEMKAIGRKVEVASSKTEGMYLEMASSREDIFKIKSKVDTLDDAVKDLIKGMEALNLKMEDVSLKKDTESLKAEVEGKIGELNKKVEDLQWSLSCFEEMVPEELTNLRDRRTDLLSWEKSLEEDFKSGKITKEAYEDAKSTCKEELFNIKKEIANVWKGRKIEEELKKNREEMESKIAELGEKVEDLRASLSALEDYVSKSEKGLKKEIVSKVKRKFRRKKKVKN